MDLPATIWTEIASELGAVAAEIQTLSKLIHGEHGRQPNKTMRNKVEKPSRNRLLKLRKKVKETRIDFKTFKETTTERLNKLEASFHNDEARVKNGKVSKHDAETTLEPLHNCTTNEAIPNLPTSIHAARKLNDAQVTRVFSELGLHSDDNKNLLEKQDALLRRMGYKAKLPA